MKQYDLGYLRENMRDALKNVPFEITYRHEVLAVCVGVDEWNNICNSKPTIGGGSITGVWLDEAEDIERTTKDKSQKNRTNKP